MRFAIAFAIALSFAALLAGRAAAAPVQAQQLEPKRTVEPEVTLEVQVTCADGAAVPDGVEVRVVADVELEHLVDRSRRAKLLSRARIGKRRGESPNGSEGATFDVARPPGPLLVVASAPGLYAEDYFLDDEDGPAVELALRTDRSLAVRVTDEHGRRMARVAVAIAHGDASGDLLAELVTSFEAVVPTREGDGIAVFEHIQEWIRQKGEDAVVLLAVPHRDHEQVVLHAAELERGTVDLHAPRFGSVELHFPGVSGATVRLRERPAPPPPDDEGDRPVEPGVWRRGEPLELEVVDGVARCDRVGIGCQLELQASWRGLATPISAEFAGPDRAGDRVTWSLVSDGRDLSSITTTLTGRLLVESATPFVEKALYGHLLDPGEDDEDFGIKEFVVSTDRSGRFELVVGPRRPTPGGHRWLHLFDAGGRYDLRCGVRGYVDLDDRLDAGTRDLGDRHLVGADAKSRIESLRDDDLIAECSAAEAWPDHAASREATVFARLSEMARRGDPRFATFIEKEIVKEGERTGDVGQEPIVRLDRALLLRRAQRRPAPIVLEPSEPVFEAITPSAPNISLLIRNVDPDFPRLAVDRLQSPGWQVTFCDASGRPLSEPDDGVWSELSRFRNGGGCWFLRSGELQLDCVPVGRIFERVLPGDYHLRVEYRIDDIVYLSSGDLSVRIKPIPIHVSRRDYDAMVSWIRAIDVAKPVPLTESPVRPTDEFEGEPKTPEDSLARRGRDALPALLDELHETTDDPRRRAWILGLLWNTHLSRTITIEQIEAAVGSLEWCHIWPTIVPNGERYNSSHLMPGSRSDPSRAPDPRVQRDLAATWTELRAWFEFTIEE